LGGSAEAASSSADSAQFERVWNEAQVRGPERFSSLQERALGKPSRSECLVTWQAPDSYPDIGLVV